MILPKVRDPRFVTIRRGGTLTDADHHLLALWAALCAEHVLGLFESARPGDPRPRQAIEHARAWVRGEVVAERRARAQDGEQPGAKRLVRLQRVMQRERVVPVVESGGGGRGVEQMGQRLKSEVGVGDQPELSEGVVRDVDALRELVGAGGVGEAQPSKSSRAARQPFELVTHNTARYRSRSYSVTWRW